MTTWPIIAAMIALMVVSLLSVRAADRAEAASTGSAVHQAVWVPAAIVAFVAVTLVPYRRIGQVAYLLFAANLALLVLVFFLAPVRNSHRWIDLRLFKLQPSELAKLTYVLAVAWYLRYRDNYRRLPGLIPPFLLTVLPAALILKEPDLGTSLVFFPTLFAMLFLAGAKLRHLLAVVAVAAAVALCPVPQDLAGMGPAEAAYRRSLAYHGPAGAKRILAPASLAFMKYHQITRIGGWLRQADARTAGSEGYQLRQSKLILSSGRWSGWGGTDGRNLHFRMLPDDHTDFIYAVIGGQWGLVGCLAVLGLYACIFICGAEIAAVTTDPFARLLAVGVLALLATQVVINVGMTIGLMPITGMTLPLVSYGGSSMVANAMALGLLVNVAQRRPMLLGRRPFEYGRKPEEKPNYETFVETPPGGRPRPRRR